MSADVSSPNCFECYFFDPIGKPRVEQGYCRRYAPRVFVVKESDEGAREIVWPVVFEDDWCGDFKEDVRASVLKAEVG